MFVRPSGGGGTGSDEVTAKLEDVLAGKTAVTRDSNDEAGVGTLPDKSGTVQAADASLDTSNSRVVLTIPAVGKYSLASKLYAAFASIASLIGLTAEKLAMGASVLGVSGSYKGLGNATAADVRKGKTFSTATLSNTAGTMAEKAAQTYYATTNDQTINANQYLTGAQTIKAIKQTNLTAENVKSGVVVTVNNNNANVFNVTGTFTSDGTAAAADILSGKKAYVKGAAVNGSMGTLAGGNYKSTTANQTISCSGKKMTSNIVITGDANLKAANIKKGITILGVAGSYVGDVATIYNGGSSLVGGQSLTITNVITNYSLYSGCGRSNADPAFSAGGFNCVMTLSGGGYMASSKTGEWIFLGNTSYGIKFQATYDDPVVLWVEGTLTIKSNTGGAHSYTPKLYGIYKSSSTAANSYYLYGTLPSKSVSAYGTTTWNFSEMTAGTAISNKGITISRLVLSFPESLYNGTYTLRITKVYVKKVASIGW